MQECTDNLGLASLQRRRSQCATTHQYPFFMAHQKKGVDLDKKIQLEDFAHIFVLLTTPYGMFEWKKNQILIADQTEGVDLDKKSTARD